jgi:hypothetical protein
VSIVCKKVRNNCCHGRSYKLTNIIDSFRIIDKHNVMLFFYNATEEVIEENGRRKQVVPTPLSGIRGR